MLVAVALSGCKEGHRHDDPPPGKCITFDSNGDPVVEDCDGGTTADATTDSDVGDASADALVDAGPDAFVLPTNACLTDLEMEFPIPDGGVDGGSVSLVDVINFASEDLTAIGMCAAGGFGPPFIQCLAAAIAQAVPEASEDCPTCYAALTECAVVNCSSGGNDACLFADQSNPTLEELLECNACLCENSCRADLDTCAGYNTLEGGGTNQACIPQGDGCLGDVDVIEQTDAVAINLAGTCAGEDPSFGWSFVLCMRDGLTAGVEGLSNSCGVCLGQQFQCLIATGCAEVCQTDPEGCNACQCQNGCRAQFDACSGFNTSEACVVPDGGVEDAGMDASVDAGGN